MSIFPAARRYQKTALFFFAILFATLPVFAREYVLEVAHGNSGFSITTNIPKAGEVTTQHAGDAPVPTVQYEYGSTLQLGFNQEKRNLEIVVYLAGHIDIKQLDMADSLKIKNNGNIYFVDGGRPQTVGALTFDCQKVRNSANLTVMAIDGKLSGDFINDGTLTIAGMLPGEKASRIYSQNFENNNTINITQVLYCDCNFFMNAARIAGDGNLLIKPVQLLNDTTASIILPKGKLSIIANSQRAEIKICEQGEEDKKEFWSEPAAGLFNFFSRRYPYMPAVKESPRRISQMKNFKRRARGDNPQKKGRAKLHHAAKSLCHNCFLLGTVNVGTIDLQSVFVELQGNITTQQDCLIQASDYLRNSGMLCSKGNLEITNTSYFFNDLRGRIHEIMFL